MSDKTNKGVNTSEQVDEQVASKNINPEGPVTTVNTEDNPVLAKALLLVAEQRSYRNLCDYRGLRKEVRSEILDVEATCQALAGLDPTMKFLVVGNNMYRVEDYCMPTNLIVAINASHIYMNADSETCTPLLMGVPFNDDGVGEVMEPGKFNAFFQRFNSGQSNNKLTLSNYQKTTYTLLDVGAFVVSTESGKDKLCVLNTSAPITGLAAKMIDLRLSLGSVEEYSYLEEAPTDQEVWKWIVSSIQTSSPATGQN